MMGCTTAIPQAQRMPPTIRGPLSGGVLKRIPGAVTGKLRRHGLDREATATERTRKAALNGFVLSLDTERLDQLAEGTVQCTRRS